MEPIIAIIKGCISNDQRCQQLLYDRYRRFALKIVFRYIFRYEKARDVVNDGFVKLFSHFSTFKAENPADSEKILIGWLRRIMINAAIDELRRSQLLPKIGGIPDEVWEIPDKNHEADQVLRYRELILLLNRLPEQYRIVFNMYVIDGYSHQEIASKLNISVGGSKSALSRSRALIQKFIKEEQHTIYAASE